MEATLQSGSLQFQPSWTLDAVIGHQLGTATYLFRPQTAPAARLRTFADNESIWQAILLERVRAEMQVTLQNFYLIEWFPRAPGLYHTDGAATARLEATAYVDSRFDRSAPACADRPRDGKEHTLVLLPEGKSSMLQGGVGCIKLKPIELAGQVFWLMTATSTGIGHEGFPVAVPNEIYQRYVDELIETGTLSCAITGHLKFLPTPLTHLLDQYSGVPRLYLQVERIESCREMNRNVEVSVAVSFLSSYQGRPGVYASYVTFEPGNRQSFADSIDWLKHTYVEQLYSGRILTDFDQTKPHFPEAALSLHKIMSRRLQGGDVREILELLHAAGQSADLLERLDIESLAQADGTVARTRVFISYSHQDTPWLERLRVFLKPLINENNLDIWDDHQLDPGSQWESKLDSALESARVAILLITADFMASDFIQTRELPKLLAAAATGRMTLLPVFIGVSAASEDSRFTMFQAVNDPRRPVKALLENDQEAVFDKVRREIVRVLGLR